MISAVNLSETAEILIRHGVDAAQAQRWLERLPLSTIDFTAPIAYRAAALAPAAKKLGLSLGDRACLATASTLSLPVLTAESTWTRLPAPLPKIHLIR